jgi:hypothetical protein
MIGAIILTMDDDLNLFEGKKYNIEKLRFYSININ